MIRGSKRPRGFVKGLLGALQIVVTRFVQSYTGLHILGFLSASQLYSYVSSLKPSSRKPGERPLGWTTTSWSPVAPPPPTSMATWLRSDGEEPLLGKEAWSVRLIPCETMPPE